MDLVINGIDYNRLLDQKLVILKWLIDGRNIHCIPMNLGKSITKEWLIKHYNVDEAYFEREINNIKK